MINDSSRPEASASSAPAARSNRKWIALAIGGGVAILACAALVVVLILLVFIPTLRQTTVQTAAPDVVSVATVPVLGEPNNTLGDPNAPVKIVEYADFQCPYCRLYWQETEPQVIETYVKTGKA